MCPKRRRREILRQTKGELKRDLMSGNPKVEICFQRIIFKVGTFGP